MLHPLPRTFFLPWESFYSFFRFQILDHCLLEVFPNSHPTFTTSRKGVPPLASTLLLQQLPACLPVRQGPRLLLTIVSLVPRHSIISTQKMFS